MSGGGARVSIPASVRRTIQNIKEIAGHHSDEDIYATLKECAMDPNETAQKLLLQDTFHEVKRKRDKRKENVRENADPRWRPGAQGRGGRGGRGNYSLRYLSNDVADGRSITSGKENGVNQGADKGNTSSLPIVAGTENKSTTSISSTVSGIANCPRKTDIPSSTQGCSSQVSGDSGDTAREESSAVETRVHVAAADPVLVPSLDARSPGEMGNIKHVIQSQGTVVEMAVNKVASHEVSGSEFSSLSGKESTEMGGSYAHEEILDKSQGSEANQLSGASQVSSASSFSGDTGSRPSSNYGNRSQQLGASQKVVSNKEWKPKSTNANPVQASGVTGNSDSPMVVEAVSQSLPVPASHSVDLKETSLKLEKKLDQLQLSAGHVIIPNHLQVPDSERHGLSFGSFDASFNFNVGFSNGHISDESATPLSGLSHEIEEIVEQHSSSIHTAPSAAPEADHADHPQPLTLIPENYSSRETDISGTSATEEHDQAKEEPVLVPEDPKYPAIQSIPSNSTFGFSPQMLGNQFAPFESSEPQAHDTTRLPNIVVQQPFDLPTSYYTQFYRPTADADGCLSPFLAPGGSTKYNGNVAVVPTQNSQAQQESGNSGGLSTAGSTLATQAAGAMQSSITVPQQPVPVFRQPAGVHLSQYPIPYSQYFSLFYVPPPTLHPFLGSAAFPQQPPIGSMYPPPGAAAAAAPVKFSLPQYKPGTDIGNSALIGMPPGYGTYNSTPAGYAPSPVVSSANSTGNEDLNSTQFKENNLYNSEQQSEGSAVWIPAHGRDISSLQASSFYNIPPQGPHMTFAPSQPGHGAFSGIYHPAPAVAATAVRPLVQQTQTVAGAVEMVGPPSGVYQQPQHAQINWTNNY